MAYDNVKLNLQFLNQQDPRAERLDVMHACPECPLGNPRTFCVTCHGRGNITQLELRTYEKRLHDDPNFGS